MVNFREFNVEINFLPLPGLRLCVNSVNSEAGVGGWTRGDNWVVSWLASKTWW